MMREYLKRLRENRSLTLAEVAKKLDISESYYSLIESGKRQEKMDLILAAKLSVIFDVPLSVIHKEERALHDVNGHEF